MLRKLVIFALICITKCDYSSAFHPVENLYAVLDQTTEYLKNLSSAHDASNDDIWNNINDAITKYMDNTKTTLQNGMRRRRRSLQNETDKDVNVLQDFKEILSLNVQNFKDVAFFSVRDGDRSLWFAATLEPFHLQIYLLNSNEAKTVYTYPQQNGKRLVTHNYNADVLIVVETNSHDIVVLHFGKDRKQGESYSLRFKQKFEIVGVMHMNMWLGMDKLYLGIASQTEISIFVWLGEHFDKIDTLLFGARKLLSFRNKSFMHIVAVGLVTKIFRFSVQANRFLEMQVLRRAEDVGSFCFKKGHFEEHFLVLSRTDSGLTVLYKEMYNRFVPFQRIAPKTESVRPLTMGNTVILFCTRENITEIYQYNGWRFLRSHTRLMDIRRIRQIRMDNDEEDTLIVQDRNEEWKFLKPVWAARKTWRSLRNEMNAWCNEIKERTSRRTTKIIPDLKNPVISSGHIGHLRVRNLNGYNSDELVHLTQRYKNVIAKLNLTNTLAGSVDGSEHRTILHGKSVRVKCDANCHVRHLKTDNGIEYPGYAKESAPIDTLRFNHLKVKAINNWRCPVPDLKMDDVLADGSVNGISMQDLREKTLKISGENQEISGEHTFVDLRARNVTMPLNIATSSIGQTVRMTEARVKRLHLTEDEFLLPLNGSTTVMNGSITAPKVTVTGTVNMRCGIKGKARDKVAPVKDISTPMTLLNDRFLQNVTFRNVVRVKDIVSTRGSSLRGILKNGVSLDSDVPVHLILSSDKTQWHNVILPSSFVNHITKNSIGTVVVSGAKVANNITLTDAAYANVPIPKLAIPLCAMGVMTLEIQTSSIAVGNLTVKNLNVSRVFGARNLNDTVFDSVPTLHRVDFSEKLFGQVFVRNASVSRIKGTDVRDLNTRMKWIDANHLGGSVNITKLVVGNLETPASFNFPLPVRVKDVIVDADGKIGRINDLDIRPFMENAMRVDEMISLEHVTFTHGFTSNRIYASRSTLNLSRLHAHPNLRSKRISTTLRTNAINIPQTFDYPANTVDQPSTFFIRGSVNFLTEPTVQTVNDANLKRLSENLWMLNQDTVVSGTNMNLRNMTLAADIMIDSSFVNSFSVKAWSSLSKRLLSKTKEQHIAVVSSFKNVETPAIVAANNSNLRCTDPNVENMLTNSLMRDGPQSVNAVWRFHELHTNDMHWNGKLNNIDLNTDVVRYDAKQNIITGEKKIWDLTARDLWLFNMNFSSLVGNAVTKKCQKLIVIKGRKTFNNITLNNLSVKGTIMGRNVETALLTFGNQMISGVKRIQGQLNAPSLITDSVVNDVNLTELINHQVKKHNAKQVIESKLDFRNDLEIFGNVTIGRYYERIDLTSINNTNELNAISNETTKIMDVAENVAAALRDHAVYVNRFEMVHENASETFDVTDTENVKDLNSGGCLYKSANVSALCNDMNLTNIIANGNSGMFIMERLVLLNDVTFVVTVSSDSVCVYSYVIAEERLYKTELYVPDVLQASAEPIDNSLWIVLRLSEQTLILSYQVWGEYEQYVLPGSYAFVMSKMPNNQHLLIRSDGMWRLGGIGQPEHIFKIPLEGQIRTFTHGADYYVKATTKNNTVVLKARYVGN